MSAYFSAVARGCSASRAQPICVLSACHASLQPCTCMPAHGVLIDPAHAMGTRQATVWRFALGAARLCRHTGVPPAAVEVGPRTTQSLASSTQYTRAIVRSLFQQRQESAVRRGDSMAAHGRTGAARRTQQGCALPAVCGRCVETDQT